MSGQRSDLRSRNLFWFWPIASQYPGHVISIDQSQASIHVGSLMTWSLVMAGPGAEEACSELVWCWAEYEEREDKTWSLVITCWAGSGGLFTLGKTNIIVKLKLLSSPKRILNEVHFKYTCCKMCKRDEAVTRCRLDQGTADGHNMLGIVSVALCSNISPAQLSVSRMKFTCGPWKM